MTKRISPVVFLFIFGLLKTVFFSSFGLKMLNDDLQNFTDAARVLDGNLVYRDYQAFFPPFADYFLAFLLKLDGFSIVASRYFYAAVASFIFPLLFLITRKVASFRISFFIAIAFIFSNTRVDVLFFHTFLLASFFLILKYLETEHYKLAFYSGLFLALGALFRIDFSISFSLGILTLLVINYFYKKDVSRLFKAGFLFVLMPAVSYLGLVVRLVDLNLLSVMFMHFKAGVIAKDEYSVNYFLPDNLFPQSVSLENGYNALTGWVYIFWLVALIGFLFWFFKNRHWERWNMRNSLISGILANLTVSLAYLHSQFDFAHFTKGWILFFPILGFIISYVKPRIFAYVAFFSLSCFLVIGIMESAWFLSSNSTPLVLDRGGRVFLNEVYIEGTTLPSTEMVKSAVDFLGQAGKGEPVFVAPYLSMLYFLSNRENPTIYDNLLKGYLVEPFGQDYVTNELARKKVKYVIYDRDTRTKRRTDSRLRDYYPAIDTYLMKNYYVDRQVGSWLFMKRK